MSFWRFGAICKFIRWFRTLLITEKNSKYFKSMFINSFYCDNYRYVSGESFVSRLWRFLDFGESCIVFLNLFGSKSSTGGVPQSSQLCCWIFGARGLDGGDLLQAIDAINCYRILLVSNILWTYFDRNIDLKSFF